MQRLGGYPRLWFSDGGSLDLDRVVPDDQVTEYEAQWRAHGVRVEWLISRRGRLDRVLPQNILRQVRNANVRSWVRAHRGEY